jgi:hypothetical protein
MNSTVLHFRTDGTVVGLYTEAIKLWELGKLRVTRASTIEFDNPLQCWRVFNAKGRCLFCAPTRQDCLTWESKYFEHQEYL